MTGGVTWSKHCIHPSLVYIMYKFGLNPHKDSRRNNVFRENTSGKSVAITVVGGGTILY